jgi:hypothetical protein
MRNQARLLRRAAMAVVALVLFGFQMSFADTAFSFRKFTGLDACNVDSPDGITFTCPEEEALPESLALFPIDATIVFSDESVARGSADLADIRSFTASAGTVLAWDLSDLHPLFTTLSVTFSEDRRTIRDFFAVAASEPVDRWLFVGGLSPQGAALESLQIGTGSAPLTTLLAVAHDILDPATGQVVRVASAWQNGRFTVTSPAPVNVAIDIKPGDASNTLIATEQGGNVTIAILTTVDFDATQVAVPSVKLWPGNAVELHNRAHFADIDSDGDVDLVMHFRAAEAGIQCGAEEALLHGATLEGTPFIGAQPVQVHCAN